MQQVSIHSECLAKHVSSLKPQVIAKAHGTERLASLLRYVLYEDTGSLGCKGFLGVVWGCFGVHCVTGYQSTPGRLQCRRRVKDVHRDKSATHSRHNATRGRRVR